MNPQDLRLMTVLLAPHITEKSTLLADKNKQFVFKVTKNATKPDIKKAVEKMFNVEVNAVHVANMKGKSKRFGSTVGQRQDWRKAYVTLKAGFDIDFTGVE